MTFWGILSMLALIGVILGSLFVTKLSLKYQEDESKKKQRARELRTELVDVDEIVNTLMIYDRNLELIEVLLRYMTDRIQAGLKLLPNSEELLQELKDVDQLNARAQSLLKEPARPETPSSDRQIFLVKKHFARAIKFIRELQAEGYFDDMASSDHRARLTQNALLLEVEAYQVQGEGAQASGDVSSAANFYKHAKEMLVNSELRFPEKSDYIKEISRKISGLYVTMPNNDEAEGAKE